MAPNDRLLHISEVVKGLACGCVCPSCGGKLVANKGQIKAHHFAHYSDRACVSAYETMLHLLAKQVIADRKHVMLPRVVAEYKGLTEIVHREMLFGLDEVIAEQNLGGMRPDIIGRPRAGDVTKDLIIEVAVSHFCEPEKRALIRERKMATIEIDLSKVSRNASREEMEQAIITTAPRTWLYNGLQESATERLRTEFERRADAAREDERRKGQQQQAKLETQAAGLAESFRAIKTVPPGPGKRADQDRVGLVSEANLMALVDIEVPGNVCFAVAASVWQSAVLDWFIFDDQSSLRSSFDTTDALEGLRKRGLVRPKFAMHISKELADAVRIKQDDFNSPWESVDAYLSHLAEQDVVSRRGFTWYRNRHIANKAQTLVRERAAGRHRVTELENRIKRLVGDRVLNAEQWMHTQHRGLADSPLALAMTGGWNYDKLDNHLRRLEQMRISKANLEEDLLGLPLEKEQNARREEQRLAAEKTQQERDERARRAAEETRQANARRRQGLIDYLVASVGDIEVEGWMNLPLKSLGGRPIGAIEGISEDQEYLAHRELMAERERRNVEARQKAIVHDLRATLRKEALRYLGAERAALWMDATNMALNKQHPGDVCIDKEGLEECRRALKRERQQR
jgi:hypothetical protein